MSSYQIYTRQLQWLTLCGLNQPGSAIAPQNIRDVITTIQSDIHTHIYRELEYAPLSASIKETLKKIHPPQETSPILWKEIRRTMAVLTEQAQLLNTLTSNTPNPKNNDVKPRSIKNTQKKPKATSPFSAPKEEYKTIPMTLTLPNYLDFLASDLAQKIKDIQTNIAIEYGFTPPNINMLFSDISSYTLQFKKIRLGEGFIPEQYFFALAPKDNIDESLDVEPTYGKKGAWISEKEHPEGWRVISPLLILESHIHDMIVRDVQPLFDWGAFNTIIAQLEENHPKLINKVIPNVLSRKQLFDIYASLLAEDIPIHHHEHLLKTVYAFRSKNKGTQFLVEQIRRALFDPMRLDSTYLYATLSKPLEKILRQGLARTETKESFKIDQPILDRLVQTLTELHTQSKNMLVLIVPPPLRSALQALIAPQRFSMMRLLSTDDIEPSPERYYAEIALNEVLYR